jgi:hypothetical protein
MKYPDIVVNKIYYYMWKLHITNVNKEYFNKFTVLSNDSIQYKKSVMCYNYRDLTCYNMFTAQTMGYKRIKYTKVHSFDRLPKYYWYSSGQYANNGYYDPYRILYQ